jgi:hypothetical protein
MKAEDDIDRAALDLSVNGIVDDVYRRRKLEKDIQQNI